MSDDFNGRYILDEAGHPMPCPDLLEWGMWLQRSQPQCRIARDQVGDCMVSTIFLALDNSFIPDGVTNDPLHYQPVLWETMVFDPIGAPIFQRRYRSRELALEGHIDAILWVERNLKLQESQLVEMLSEISKSVVPDRGPSTDQISEDKGEGLVMHDRAEDSPAEHPDQHPENEVRSGPAIPQRLTGFVVRPDPEEESGDVEPPEEIL